MIKFTFQDNFCDYRIENGVGRGRKRGLSRPESREKMAMAWTNMNRGGYSIKLFNNRSLHKISK